jgi:hypothetical protein
MTEAEISVRPSGFGRTMRADAWWVQPLLVFLVLSAFVVYATWAALQGDHYAWGPYLSPFYSPLIFGEGQHAWIHTTRPAWWPPLVPVSAAILILWIPALFRVTCYYYRGSYYKAFWADPPACTVGEPRACYRGERSFPLVLQNVHRYFLYLALLFLVVLARDVWEALWFTDPVTGRATFGVGVGTLVLAINVVLLAGYTLGCHSLRHLVGGGRDEISRSPLCQRAYAGVSALNRWHHHWGWPSLFCVAFADIYVRMLSMGVWHDVRLL